MIPSSLINYVGLRNWGLEFVSYPRFYSTGVTSLGSEERAFISLDHGQGEETCKVRAVSSPNKVKPLLANNTQLTLNSWFITGISDGEGCFTLSVIKDNKRKVGWRIFHSFQIAIHIRDKTLLKQIQSYFLGVGSIISYFCLVGSITFDVDSFLLCSIIPIKIYSNAEADKGKIISDNKKKSGIYVWKNLVNQKQYIGSSDNLRRRFNNYFNPKHLLKYDYMYINRALLKHGYSNFSLSILEYCEPEQCLERENFYLSNLPHEYNLLHKAGSSLGNKHSEESKKKSLMLWLEILIAKINLTLNK
jgi:hypothetical protein